jgi:hypothetical protein
MEGEIIHDRITRLASSLDDFQQTLDKFNVPQAEQKELFGIVESTREAIVISPLQENPGESKI